MMRVAKKKVVESVMDIEEIKRYIPHRYPMLMIDKVIDIIPGESATGIKAVTFNEFFFQGHFPDEPIMPGVLIIEAMAQTCGIVAMKFLGDKNENPLYFLSIEDARFRKPVVPGDILYMKAQKKRSRGPVWRFEVNAYVDDTLVAETKLTAMINL